MLRNGKTRSEHQKVVFCMRVSAMQHFEDFSPLYIKQNASLLLNMNDNASLIFLGSDASLLEMI